MDSDQDHQFIRRAIALADSAKKKTNYPFGALLVLEGNIILEAENSTITDRDRTRHAEMNLASAASKKFSELELASCVLYSSTEPCAMCAGAIYWVGIRNVVYGCDEANLRSVVRPENRDGNLGVACRDILLRHGVKITGPVLEQEALQVHIGFW